MAYPKGIFLAILLVVSHGVRSSSISVASDDVIAIRAGDPVTYTGGVLEFESYEDWKDGGEGIIRENARRISEFAADAKAQGVDILVSAEYGLQSLEMHKLIPDELFSVMQHAPDPELSLVPCTLQMEPPNTEGITTLSCTAKENEMYLVVDLGEASPCSPDVRNPFNNTLDTSYDCPESGYIYYNTQVVFDRNGAIVARYRKKNLFLEPQFTAGTQPNEDSIFTTDFGITFTTHVCFDIAFFSPSVSNIENYGIQDVIMSTAWIDILPFYIAPSIQNTWSRGMGVNLLVSGYHKPERAKMGSGIYRGASDLAFDYIYDTEISSKLLVMQIDTVASIDVKLKDAIRLGVVGTSKQEVQQTKMDSIITMPSLKSRNHTMYYDDLTNYTQVPLTHGDSEELQEAEACHQDGLCCKLSYYPTGNLNYSLVAYSGRVVKGFIEFHIYAQVCSILWCQTNDDITTCSRVEDGLPDSDNFKPFSLEANFGATHIFPSACDRHLAPLDNTLYNFTENNQTYTLSTKEAVKDLMVGGLYGRWYERDSDAKY